MMGGFYGQFDDGAMKCPPVSGVSGESQRGPELLRLRSLSHDVTETRRATEP